MKPDMKMIDELRKRLPPEAQDIIDEVEAQYMGEEEAEMEETPVDETAEIAEEDEAFAEDDSEAEEIASEAEAPMDEEEDLPEEDFEVPAFFRKKKSK